MAESKLKFDSNKFQKAYNMGTGALGSIGTLAGIPQLVSKAEGVSPYLSQLGTSRMNYLPGGSVDNFMQQYQASQMALPKIATAEDFYNPSASQQFAQLFGASKAAYDSGQWATEGLTGTLGTTQFGNLGGNNDSKAHAWGGELDNGAMAGQGIQLGLGAIGFGVGLGEQLYQGRLADSYAGIADAGRNYLLESNRNNTYNQLANIRNSTFNDQGLRMAAFGGQLSTNGADFPNNGGLNFINNGGTHEKNPNNGVPQGVSIDGQQNLVEEGEVVWNDYVFSNRLKVSKDTIKKYKLKENSTFAEAAKKLSAEIEERPNDPISNRGIEVTLGDLQAVQEELRMKKQAAELKRVINKMSPEELMQLQAMAAQWQQALPQQQVDPNMQNQQAMQEQAMQEQAMAQEQGGVPQEGMFANGGYLFDDGGRVQKLFENYDDSQLLHIAASLGTDDFDPDKYQHNQAKPELIKYIMNNAAYAKDYKMALESINSLARVGILKDEDVAYDYSKSEKNKADVKAYNERITNYRESLNKGKSTGKYAESKTSNKENEELLAFQEFWDYMLHPIDKNNLSDPNSDDSYRLGMLKKMDANINKETGVASLFDKEGNLREDWIDIAKPRTQDYISGQFHVYGKVPEKAIGERYVVRGTDGRIYDMDYNKINPLYRVVNQGDDPTDKEGNITHYKTVALPEYNVPEETDGGGNKPIVPKPTWYRDLAMLGPLFGLGMNKQDDNTMAVSPTLPAMSPIGDYLGYNPIDSQRYINANNQQVAQQLNAVYNMSGANTQSALAQAALLNREAQVNQNEKLAAIEAANFERKAKVGEFNRGTNQTNAGMFSNLQQQYQALNNFMLDQGKYNATARKMDRDAYNVATSEGLTQLFNNLGNRGLENYYFNQVASNPALRYGQYGNGVSFFKGNGTSAAGATTGNQTSTNQRSTIDATAALNYLRKAATAENSVNLVSSGQQVLSDLVPRPIDNTLVSTNPNTGNTTLQQAVSGLGLQFNPNFIDAQKKSLMDQIDSTVKMFGGELTKRKNRRR